MDPVRHAHVTDVDFHGPLAVLVFQKNRNALPVSVLDGVADPLEKVVPLRRVIGLERVVVPVDSRPNDEVGIELGSNIDGATVRGPCLAARTSIRVSQCSSAVAGERVSTGSDGMHIHRLDGID